MSYNLSLINGSGVVPLLTTVNSELMFGWYGNLILITLGVILFMAYFYKTADANKSLAFASLIVALSSIFLRIVGLVNDISVLISWVITAIVVAIAYLSD